LVLAQKNRGNEFVTLISKSEKSYKESNGHIIPKRNHDKLGSSILSENPEYFFKWSVHVDTPQTDIEQSFNNLQSHTSMYMINFEYPESVGSTSFLSLVDLFNNCPIEFKKKLAGCTIEEWKNSGTQLLNLWKPFHIHPITQEKIMFWPSWWVKLHDKQEPWFDDLINWVRLYLSNKDNWFRWSWKKGDFLMFDNRSLVHSFENGWDPNKRVFSQGGISGKPPIELKVI
jgi:hypothetical protein